MGNLEIYPPWIVTSATELSEVVSEIENSPQLAVDIESDSFYAYRERVCLIQISSPAKDYIIDPLAIQDLSPLGKIFSNPAMEKIFHAGEYDVLCLKRDYQFEFRNLFDTMIAARFLGEKELGLKAAISKHFKIELCKKHQRADWGKRPLSDEQLRYAQLDTHFLISLSNIQKKSLFERERFEDAKEAAESLSALQAQIRPFDSEGYRKIKGHRDLSPESRGILKELYLCREEIARTRNKARFRIMNDELLIQLAKACPRDVSELAPIKGMTPYLLQAFGRHIVDCVLRGEKSPETLLHCADATRVRRTPPEEVNLFEKLRLWRKTRGETEGLDPAAILSTEQLKDIAHALWTKKTDVFRSLSPLKKNRYEQSLLKFISSIQE
jgi:ribonuclease D